MSDRQVIEKFWSYEKAVTAAMILNHKIDVDFGSYEVERVRMRWWIVKYLNREEST